MMKLGTFERAALMIAASCAAVAAMAQAKPPSRSTVRTTRSTPAKAAPPKAAPGGQAQPAVVGGSAQNLNIPANPTFVADSDTSVRKATAIVNGAVITGTDVDQRMALILLANGGQIPREQIPALRDQVLRNLVDETLQIQAAEQEKIKVTDSDIAQYFTRYAASFKQTPQQFAAFLKAQGSSAASVQRQIRGEISWARLQSSRIEPFVNVSEDEVKQVMGRLNASKGMQQYKVAEIFLSATPETAPTVRANADRILQQLRGGASFEAYAHQFSEASTAAVGGELGWVQAEQLPEPLAAVVRTLPVGAVSDPVAIPGGFSILWVEDTRQLLTADPRDALLSLKQLSISFPQGTAKADADAKIQELVRTTQSMGGCGGADAAAQRIGAEVVSNDQVRVRDLPASLQNILLGLGVGQATAPFGAVNQRVSVLVLCGRDDPPPPGELSYDQVYRQIADQRVSMRARRYLRDLRRDAVVDYR
jgi:peptidyl-prolyl cis-trans isomerase SurA